MKSFISFLILLFIKLVSNIFYRFEIGWLNTPKNSVKWNDIKLILLLNHTSLLEPLYVGVLPISFLWKLSKTMVAPGADKTLNRPIVGLLYKLFSPGMTSITRKRDDTWKQFLETIHQDAIIVFIPEGRMKRPNGLDLHGNKMTVKMGVTDVFSSLKEGTMAVAYSGGLHHIHEPGEKMYRLFKKIKVNLEFIEIKEYKNLFTAIEGSEEWRKEIVQDLQHRLETKVPTWEKN